MKVRGPLLLAVLCALALAAGCTTAAPPSGVVAAPSLRPVSSDLRQSYLAYWDAWLKANRTSNPDEPSLLEHAASPLLNILRANLTAARERNQVAKGTVGHRLRGMEPDGSAPRVLDCIDLDKWLLYDATTGKQLDQLVDKPSQAAVFTLRRQHGRWRVTDSRVVGQC